MVPEKTLCFVVCAYCADKLSRCVVSPPLTGKPVAIVCSDVTEFNAHACSTVH